MIVVETQGHRRRREGRGQAAERGNVSVMPGGNTPLFHQKSKIATGYQVVSSLTNATPLIPFPLNDCASESEKIIIFFASSNLNK